MYIKFPEPDQLKEIIKAQLPGLMEAQKAFVEAGAVQCGFFRFAQPKR